MVRPKTIYGSYGLDDWVRIALPGIRHEDRWKIFREWQAWRCGSLDAAEEKIKEWRRMRFDDSEYLLDLMAQLRFDFLPAYRKARRRMRARMAANKRWAKKTGKTLDPRVERWIWERALHNLIQA
jgi:hypothetical protein